MDRVEPVPIEQSSQPERIEHSRLGDPAAALDGFRLELQPDAARQFHSGAELQEAILLPRLHQQEVERVPCPQFDGMTAPPRIPTPPTSRSKKRRSYRCSATTSRPVM